MSFESSPYLPVSVSRSSNTGVSMDTAPWRLNTASIVPNTRRRIIIWVHAAAGVQAGRAHA